MDLNEQVREALEPLFQSGLVHDAHIQMGAPPGKVNVVVSLNAHNPELLREDIMRRLEEHGLKVVSLNLFTNPLWRP